MVYAVCAPAATLRPAREGSRPALVRPAQRVRSKQSAVPALPNCHGREGPVLSDRWCRGREVQKTLEGVRIRALAYFSLPPSLPTSPLPLLLAAGARSGTAAVLLSRASGEKVVGRLLLLGAPGVVAGRRRSAWNRDGRRGGVRSEVRQGSGPTGRGWLRLHFSLHGRSYLRSTFGNSTGKYNHSHTPSPECFLVAAPPSPTLYAFDACRKMSIVRPPRLACFVARHAGP